MRLWGNWTGSCQVRGDEWLIGNRMTQADITATCVYTFLSDALGINRETVVYPALDALAARCEALPEFLLSKAEGSRPSIPRDGPRTVKARHHGKYSDRLQGSTIVEWS